MSPMGVLGSRKWRFSVRHPLAVCLGGVAERRRTGWSRWATMRVPLASSGRTVGDHWQSGLVLGPRRLLSRGPVDGGVGVWACRSRGSLSPSRCVYVCARARESPPAGRRRSGGHASADEAPGCLTGVVGGMADARAATRGLQARSHMAFLRARERASEGPGTLALFGGRKQAAIAVSQARRR